jgi:hypothetical protein
VGPDVANGHSAGIATDWSPVATSAPDVVDVDEPSLFADDDAEQSSAVTSVPSLVVADAPVNDD